MQDLFFGGYAPWFTWPAFIGTLFFIIRLAMMLIGGVADVDVDTDVDVPDADLSDVPDMAEGDAHDSTEAFKFLSVQSVLAFAMGFGWGGLGALKGSGIESPFLVVLIAIACGVGMVWILALMLKAMADLQSSGNISIQSTLGLEGTVYASIPAGNNGRGRIRLVVDDRMRTYAAVTEGEELPTQSRVRVTRVNSDNTLTVARI